MRRFNPLVPKVFVPPRRFNPLLVNDQAYGQLLLPAAGAVAWTALNHIVVEYKVPNLPGPFAIIRAPATAMSLFVRDNATRYQVTGTDTPNAYFVPYAGQTLTPQATFEFWAKAPAPGGATLPAYTLTISYREQLCCGETSGDVNPYVAYLYMPYCRPFPVCLPIC